MNFDRELGNLCRGNSLVRTLLRPTIKLSDIPIDEHGIPTRFRDRSLLPTNGLDLNCISKGVSRRLTSLGADTSYVRQVVAGLCEAVKNAYEHGNSRDPNKLVTLAECIKEEGVEFLVGDQGGVIDGNFLAYILLFRQGSHQEFFTDVPDFYDFRGDSFAPEGHSGIGTKVMHIGFPEVRYFKSTYGGLLVYLKRPLEK